MRWIEVKDGNADARALFHRHYSYRAYKDGRRVPKLFVGPGQKLVLLSEEKDALFVWRKFKSRDGQTGINCAVFRNESRYMSSSILQFAEEVALKRWPGERLFTYINTKKIKSINPGYCFKVNGWKKCGVTKRHKLLILEKLPL